MKLTINDIAQPLQTDIDSLKHVDAPEFDKLVNRCVSAATTAFDNPTGDYSEFERWHLAQIISSMGHSHRSVRNLVGKGRENPESVDSLIIARAQVESIFNLYLVLQEREMLTVFLKDSWRKKYVRFLVERQECGNLPRFREYLEEQAVPLLEKLRAILGVTDEEKETIEADLLGTAMPASGPKPIRLFPTPKRALNKMVSTEKKAVLARLYPEYQWLSSFVHGSPECTLNKCMFDKRSKYIDLFPS